MTVRVYLGAARVVAGQVEQGDIPAERLFIHSSELPEIWIETESLTVPAPGKSVAFCLAGKSTFGVGRIIGTVERIVNKETRERIRTGQ